MVSDLARFLTFIPVVTHSAHEWAHRTPPGARGSPGRKEIPLGPAHGPHRYHAEGYSRKPPRIVRAKVELPCPPPNNIPMTAPVQSSPPRLLLACMAAAIIVSSFGPSDRFTWFLETVPIMIGMPLLWFTARGFPLTPMLRILIGVHACILALGGAYTYAEVPMGFWIQDALGFARNPYDRIGHLAQGFIPAILAREIILRRTPLKRGAWLSFLTVSVCLAFSAFYELIEWWAAITSGESATAFLGTQGDVWDTQWDMCLALIGACVAVLTLAGLHNRQLKRLGIDLET